MAWSRRRLVLTSVGGVFALLVGYLLLWPVDIRPVAWRAPAASVGYERNDALAQVEWIARGAAPGPEGIAFDAQGRLWTGLIDGRIVRVAEGGEVTEVARTGGRPLGLEFDASGRLIIADADAGLLALGADGKLEVLAAEVDGKRMRFTDDVAIARDGTIYFSDASMRWPLAQYRNIVLEHSCDGRLLAYRPDTKQVEVVAGGLCFANGVALAPDEASALVAETMSYRVSRVWLVGERRGQVEEWVERLPGFPDNVTWSPSRQVFWVAIGPPRDPTFDALAPHPFWRKVVARLPLALQPQIKRHATALAFDANGKLVANLQHVGSSSYSPIASVIEHDGWLYLGSFVRDGVGRVKAP